MTRDIVTAAWGCMRRANVERMKLGRIGDNWFAGNRLSTIYASVDDWSMAICDATPPSRNRLRLRNAKCYCQRRNGARRREDEKVSIGEWHGRNKAAISLLPHIGKCRCLCRWLGWRSVHYPDFILNGAWYQRVAIEAIYICAAPHGEYHHRFRHAYRETHISVSFCCLTSLPMSASKYGDWCGQTWI